MLDGLEANVSSLDGEGNFTFLEDFEVFTFRDAINVAAYMVMSAGQGREQKGTTSQIWLNFWKTSKKFVAEVLFSEWPFWSCWMMFGLIWSYLIIFDHKL